MQGQAEWCYIEGLASKQHEAGLRLGNKLTQRHINFEQQKMKVSLAAQTLSSSVATAIQYMREMGDSEFQDTEATEFFLRLIDTWFDIMNSHNIFCTGYKRAIDFSNLQFLKQFCLKLTKYLQTIKLPGGKSLLWTAKYVGIYGVITGLNTLVYLSEKYLSSSSTQPLSLKYIPTYKFSQDHIELFFNCIRGCCGWNNNPSPLQFMYVYRRMLARCGANPSNSGNVTPQDNTDIPSVEISDLESDNEMILTDFISACVGYIGGSIIRNAQKKIKCVSC